MDINATLLALEQLASSPSTSSSGPLNTLLEEHFAAARQRITAGEDAKIVITDLQAQVAKSKKQVEKGLKGWYTALGGVGKAIEKQFPPILSGISDAYSQPALFASDEAREALERAVVDSIARQGVWDAVEAFEEETVVVVEEARKGARRELCDITEAIRRGDVEPALRWCDANATFLSTPPHPPALPYHLHRSVFLRMTDQGEAIRYAGRYLMQYTPTQPVLQLITSCLYPGAAGQSTASGADTSPGAAGLVGGSNGHSDGSTNAEDTDIEMDGGAGGAGANGSASGAGLPPLRSPYTHDPAPLISMFRAEYCRLHGWPKEDPLEVAVDLGSRGGALAAIEKARKVMGERLGSVRTWTDLPMEIPLPDSRRYHSVFVCPVSKEQATGTNPPKMLLCGHVLAAESFSKMMKGGRRQAKCPYCPVETSSQAAQRLYF